MRKIVHTGKNAQKRRDTWSQTWMSYLANKYSLEDIRKKTFGEIDSEKELKNYLGKQVNPILGFQNGEFFFDEKGLHKALQAIKADLSQFRMEVQEYEKTEVTDRYPFSGREYDRRGHDILLFYARRKDVQTQTCILTYQNICMEIRRWNIKGSRFGTYEMMPIRQIPCTKWVLTEAEFNWLDIPNLLIDLAMEYELCKEEFTYHSKQLRISLMETSILDEDHIPFATIDEATIGNLIKECETKQLDKELTFKVIVQPWMDSIRDYLLKITNKYNDRFYVCNLRVKPREGGRLVHVYDPQSNVKGNVTYVSKAPIELFIELCKEKQVEVECKYSETINLSNPSRMNTHAWFKVKETELEMEETLFHYTPQKDMLVLFPNSKDRRFQIEINGSIGFHALVGYLKLMPELCQQMDDLQKKIDRFLNF